MKLRLPLLLLLLLLTLYLSIIFVSSGVLKIIFHFYLLQTSIAIPFCIFTLLSQIPLLTHDLFIPGCLIPYYCRFSYFLYPLLHLLIIFLHFKRLYYYLIVVNPLLITSFIKLILCSPPPLLSVFPIGLKARFSKRATGKVMFLLSSLLCVMKTPRCATEGLSPQVSRGRVRQTCRYK